MQRRDFIKGAALAAGVAAFAPAELLNAEPAAKKAAFPAGPYRKSIMWGTVGVKGSVLEKCKAIKAAGFEGMEPNSHMNRQEVIDALGESGLVASSLCNGKHWEFLMSSPDPAVRSKGITAMIHAMEDAKAYGTDAVLLVPGRVDSETSYQQCWDRSTECIKELIPVARDLKIKICIENVWNNFLLSPIDAKLYVDQFKSKWVKFYFDCGNIRKTGWPEQWIPVLGERIERIHIKEFSKTMEDELGPYKGFNVKLTEGEVNWKAVKAEMDKCYTGCWLTTEIGMSNTPEELADMSARLSKVINL